MQPHELVVPIFFVFPLLHEVADHLLLDGGQVGLQPRDGFIATQNNPDIFRAKDLGNVLSLDIRRQGLLVNLQMFLFYSHIVIA